jgi:UDP-N-acetylglucosamine--N-acetylmuramyl-(pentapeptide) pyrophosphoryl-undecaprenol N-acetylglucosamine transferase
VKVFTASDGMEKFFPAEKIVITGNPVRTSIVANTISREEGIKFFGLNPEKKTVLLTGGSLGAKSINEAVDMHIDEFEKNDLQLIWQTGKPYADKAKQVVIGRNNIWTNDFIAKMEYAFAAADMVISRSGAMSIAELCVVKKPVVFVPFPFAAEDHQTVNAQSLVNKNAGILIKDNEAKEKLISTTIALAKDESRQNELKENIAKLGVTNADEVAREILKLIS